MRLSISEEHVIDAGSSEETPPFDPDEALDIKYNNTDPLTIRDGIGQIRVVSESQDRYLLEYYGFETGYLRVTREGVAEFGRAHLTSSDDIPRWIIESVPEGELPWWVPEKYDGDRLVACDRCLTEMAATDVVTPGGSEERYCQDCWVEVSRTDGRNDRRPSRE